MPNSRLSNVLLTSHLVNRISDVEAGNEGRDGRPRVGNISTVYVRVSQNVIDYMGTSESHKARAIIMRSQSPTIAWT